MTKIGIITGSTRPGRNSLQVAEWVKGIADQRGDADYELVDLAEYNLPMYAEPVSAAYSQDYQTPEAIPWAKRLQSWTVMSSFARSTTMALRQC